jgi:hypothetical protein
MDELLAAVEPFFLGANEALPQIGIEEVNHTGMDGVDNRVVIPANTHLRDIVRSADVSHSWAVPSLNSSGAQLVPLGAGAGANEGASSPKLPILPSSPINSLSSGGSSKFSEFFGLQTETSSSATEGRSRRSYTKKNTFLPSFSVVLGFIPSLKAQFI